MGNKLAHIQIDMRQNEIEAFLNLLIGRRLENIGYACEIIDIGFSDGLALHAMGFGRIILNDDILVTTLDYQVWDEKDSANNDEYLNIAAFRDKIVGGMVLSVTLSKLNDLYITLDNGIRIECLIANAYPHFDEEREQWLLFECPKLRSGRERFLTAYNKHLEFP